ncbi:hypothetical protein M2451_000205 [Dysgonomonas sp. PFB1-18]|uniref:DUF4924 family protein n=1 Tax=unclassified Dysgonomonas TaxID=2630389 RepID=UPI002474E0DB|nr:MULTISPECIES: DUF4924 family protein [unclassified Dysgonomonas]MDH6307756.1 hypothetical protein [Dysgonomonas sp. PF1-14]MDH6337674.1 hypothetical protein [Dysgonomonas sp. PF1-16]MDH6378898.1 hypothetical protein [Dysgonomonas sp. PFB1-18]MDH6396533.1 hypothetical protein [Dysgonomonas sp. PF1-23]
MLIAKKLKEENISEYLLYMWQVEDLIRTNGLDIDKIDALIVSRFDQPENVKAEIKEWYGSLIEMMRCEGVTEKGHLIINKNVIADLTDLHTRLLKSANQSDYSDAYYKTLPFIVELRAKSPDKDIPELETCFAALYGYLLMRLQKKEVSGETQAAISQISSLLRLLSQKYKSEKGGKLDI